VRTISHATGAGATQNLWSQVSVASSTELFKTVLSCGDGCAPVKGKPPDDDDYDELY